MFRRVIYPTEPGSALETAMLASRKRMKFSRWSICALASLFIAGLVVLRIEPDALGTNGKRLLGSVLALIVAQGVNWIVESQRFRKLARVSKT